MESGVCSADYAPSRNTPHGESIGLSPFMQENEHDGRQLFVDLEPEPSVAKKKETLLALRSWLRTIVRDMKAHWRPRWVYGGTGSDGKCYVTTCATARAGCPLEELQHELHELFL